MISEDIRIISYGLIVFGAVLTLIGVVVMFFGRPSTKEDSSD